ncbi:hypothetical protein AVEN_20560-1 [Araneus ventricosus]|uniref:Uncharacterized protein n=1 Tax=Araneus ventricosus TaxID=182803 RepID=A0A4Y1ZPK0_ARAVE|nr:hypothetical protein AVEN_225649-1 [Araneus ventricosus]GBL61036.1 hypothetical protein AVEN_20560-1 [Araneus ventricosus]
MEQRTRVPISKSSGQFPKVIAFEMSNKYCFPLLSKFLSISGIEHGFIIDHREFFTSSELLPDYPTKRFRPCSLIVNMLENVAKRKLIEMQVAYAPLSGRPT